jgi:hypothetical protein
MTLNWPEGKKMKYAITAIKKFWYGKPVRVLKIKAPGIRIERIINSSARVSLRRALKEIESNTLNNENKFSKFNNVNFIPSHP